VTCEFRAAPGAGQFAAGAGPADWRITGPVHHNRLQVGPAGRSVRRRRGSDPDSGRAIIDPLSLPVRWAAVHRGTIAGLGRVLDLLSDIIYIYSKIISTLRGYKLYFMPVNGLLLDSEVTVPARKFGLVYA